jgi:hypothetical protein
VFILIGLFLTGGLKNHSQAQGGTISGTVSDAVTAELLPFAHVFINQTTIGVVTDNQGYYSIRHIPAGESTLVVSFVGYKTYLLKVQVKEGVTKQADIRLEPDGRQLDNVEVKGSRDKEWDKHLKKFEKLFLGSNSFAKSTSILNPWILDFNESGNMFMATSSSPLEIENKALGYRVFYYLKDMVATSEGYRISGEVRFEEMSTDDSKLAGTWNENRKAAYKGSLHHLVKAILDDRVKQEGFNLYSDMIGYEKSPNRSTVFSEQLNKTIQAFSTKNSVSPGKAEGEFIIQLKQRLEIHYIPGRTPARVYNDIYYPVSWLEVNDGFIRVNTNGIVLNPPYAVVSGAMYDSRVANILPYNYSPD